MSGSTLSVHGDKLVSSPAPKMMAKVTGLTPANTRNYQQEVEAVSKLQELIQSMLGDMAADSLSCQLLLDD